ncbi:MAG: acetyltransferase, partial [Tannerella sp.]|nr:acetyltransferase [Tannerella sp.]
MGNKILYIIIYMYVRASAALPLRALYVLSDFLYLIIYYIAHYRRKVVRGNMQKSFPEKSENELKKLERRFYHHFADYIIETIKLAGMKQEELLRRANIRNPELIYDLQDKGHTCFILMLGHYGNWEWFSGVGARFEGRSKIYQIYRPLTSKPFDKLFIYLRTRFNSIGIKKNEAVREMVRLKQNKTQALVPFVADQTPSRS